MATRREIKRRIRSITNTAQITKAMQMVAAARMRRAQQRVQGSRPYAESINEIVADVSGRPGAGEHPLLVQREIRAIDVVFITPDRGLAGAMIGNLNRRLLDLRRSLDKPVRVIAVGRKGRDFALRAGFQVVAEFTGLSDQATSADIRPIAQEVLDDYSAGRADQVFLLYTEFINTLRQQPKVEQIVPVIPPEGVPITAAWSYEPDNPVQVLSALLPRYLEFTIYHAQLESFASYYSAQMIAMSNATDNAQELIKELTLLSNKARQAEITKEIAEISAGAEAIRAG
ncbi:MAG TPA: ATP synthase F1 subunit gamma [Chloroflexota bacterium]|nr:ATP synthase F1 subunit gamma [Chloroflexota bacterium]